MEYHHQQETTTTTTRTMVLVTKNSPPQPDSVNRESKRQRQPSFRMFLSAFAALLSAMCMGIVLGWSSPALTSMTKPTSQPHLHSHPDQQDATEKNWKTWMASCITLGALAGSLSSGYINNFIGRRWTLIVVAIPFIIGWMVIGLAKSFATVVVGRVITGVCAGLITGTTPPYVAEIVTPETRGFLGACFQLLVNVGILFTTLFATMLEWNTLSVFAIVPIVMYAIGMYFAPETPIRLVERAELHEASEVLRSLRNATSDHDAELAEIIERIRTGNRSNNGTGFRLLRRRDVYMPFIIAIALQFFQQFCGINAIMFYLAPIFADSGTSMDSTLAAILVFLFLTFATLAAANVMDRFGRKILLLSSATGMAISMIIMAIYYVTGTHEAGFIPVICLILMVVSFSIGFGPIPWMIVAEITPTEAVSLVTPFATAVNWLGAFLVTKEFEDMVSLVHKQGVYGLFGIVCIVAIAFIWLVVPETKHRTVEQIQQHFLGR